ncbi:MAG: hypothetical protein KAS32_19255 [Candidatus Peribacteraceae bacterium]|nr:hypothetical protein [Candidatus Peribacteraceae bacterium]
MFNREPEQIIFMKYASVITFIFFMGLFFSLASQNASADLLVEGYKSVGYCFEISNIDDYPDYIFLLVPTIMGGNQIIVDDQCMHFYKHASPKIYAVEKTTFNQEELESFNEKNSIPSDIVIRSVGQVIDTDPTNRVKDVMEIISLTSEKLEIHKSKTVYTYEDGTIEEQNYVSQNTRPPASRKPLIPLSYTGLTIAVPLLAIILIVIIVAVRKFRRKKNAQLPVGTGPDNSS